MKETICIFSGASWEKWDFRNLEIGIGGSEISVIHLSREFYKLGYRVVVFADCIETGIKDGNIIWYNYSEFKNFTECNFIDYFISSRTEDPFKYNIRSKKNFIISHDIWLLSGKEIKYFNKINKYLCLSEWHKEFFSDYHNIIKDKIVVSANGIDFNRFDNINVERNPYRLHWSSSWDRGLDNVLYLWPWIKKEIPQAELHCFYGTLTWKKACEQRGDVEGLKKIDELEKLVKQDGIFTYGRVSQLKLAEEIKKASLLLYPSAFSETFWITGIEAQYSGVPIICNKYAGVTTTLGDTAIMLGNGDAWYPYSKEGREAFLAETISVLKDKDKWKKWSDLGKENAKRFSWEKVALMWDKLFKE